MRYDSGAAIGFAGRMSPNPSQPNSSRAAPSIVGIMALMSDSANEHPTVELEGVAIDVEIAPLIELLWDLNIDTMNSCQNNHGRVWLEFASPPDAEMFLNTVATYEDDIDSLYNRIRGAWSPAEQQEG